MRAKHIKAKPFPARIIIVLVLSCFGLQLHAQSDSKKQFAADYIDYLKRKFPADISQLEVGKKEISFQASFPQGSNYKAEDLAIAILPPHAPSQIRVERKHLANVKLKRTKSGCRATIGRRSVTGAERAQRRFVLVHRSKEKGVWTRLSASVYPMSWQQGVQRDLKKLVGRDQKGLGGIPNNSGEPEHQIYDLGLSHATINIVLNSLVRNKQAAGFEKRIFEGREVFVHEKRLRQYDNRLERLRANDIVASMILLVGNRQNKGGQIDDPMVHPEADAQGKFAMPNLATPEGAFLYRAIIHELAERFTREGSVKARVTNWIMHNEVDQSGVWTTMGEQPIERYVETYMRSARVVHHATRQFDPHARVFVSLTHHWNKISGGKHVYRVIDIVEFFNRASKVEGDFEWGVAYHPYPHNLREPRTWTDKPVKMSFSTPFITPRNIEVLPAYLSRRHLRYLGKHERPILLSEQGCSAQSASLEDQKVQAAGIVYIFNRIRQLPTVEAFHYHAYRDSPVVEGGCRFGLVDENENPKFAWDVYQSLNSEAEKKATMFAWPIMGPAARRHALAKPATKIGK